MPAYSVTLLLCALGAVHAAVAPPRARAPRSPADSDLLQIPIAEYIQRASGAWAGGNNWLPSAIPLQVSLQGDNSVRPSVSVLVLPVPVPVSAPAPRADPIQCTLNSQPADIAPPRTVVSTFSGGQNEPPRTVVSTFSGGQNETPRTVVPTYSGGQNEQPRTVGPEIQIPVGAIPSSKPPASSTTPEPYTPPVTSTPLSTGDAVPSTPSAPPVRPTKRPPVTEESIDSREAYFPPVEDSRLLVRKFRAQVPIDPSLPPIGTEEPQVEAPTKRRLTCKRRRPESEAQDRDNQDGEALEAPPPPPRFERSLYVRARLTVPRAEYTEPYAMWWDAASGAARVDFHGGTTSSYRMVKRDGRMQSAQILVDRSGEAEVRRCILAAPRRLTRAERTLPVLPDLQAFYFAGYVVHGTERAESWRHTLSGHSGELGGVRGEALTFRHELVVTRSADNYTTTPHWYSVRVDSSVLGADCDGYVHYFDEVQARNHESFTFQLEIADACDEIETTNRMEDVEPFREFTMLRRDPRHDALTDQYKQKFARVYADDREEAVRKNLLMQMTRFTQSGNRQGATMLLGTNFISDRLLEEQDFLLGTVVQTLGDQAQPLPISDAEVEALRDRLPNAFDWRVIGAVSKVRNQIYCASCWAISTVGAVEAQLFTRTKRLVPLSEQVLIDCAKPYGGEGCKASKQRNAYNYMIDNGLPAYDAYPFVGNGQQCYAESVTNVTRISGYYNITRDSILTLKVAIRRYGPVVVSTDSSLYSFKHYKTGRFYDVNCTRYRGNHGMLVVGWKDMKQEGETDFIVKNSWGATTWGERGYVRMRMANKRNCGAKIEDACADPCGLLRRASLPILRDEDVLSVPGAAQTAARGRAVPK